MNDLTPVPSDAPPVAPPGDFSLRRSNQREDRRPHAVVIGSGFGGLAAAIRLGARGYRVTVVEKLDQPGGRARVIEEGGHVFDAGPTLITVPFLFEQLWELCGRKLADDVAIVPLDPFYSFRFDDGETFTYTGDPAQMRAEVARLSPGDVAGYERFMALAEKICAVGFDRLGHVSFGSIRDMLAIAPEMARLQSYRSVYGLVSRYVRDPRLRTVFSYHPLLIGGNPFKASALYALIPHLERRWGVHYALGGVNRLVAGLCGLIAGQGGTVRLGAEVEEILVENGRARGVRLAGGETIRSAIVVSDAGSAWTYGRLLPPSTRKRWSDRKLARARYSMGVVVWYFGVNRRYEDVDHHTILLGPRYRELIGDIFERKRLAEDDFSLYLHRPTATDPSVAPPGRDTFYALVPVPNLDGDTDWTREAEIHRERIARRLEATLLPGLRENLTVSRMVTPLDFEADFRAVRGAAFDLEPVFTQSAWFRPHNRSEDVGGLYIVGAGTHPGAGMPGVLSSARVLDEVVPHGESVDAAG